MKRLWIKIFLGLLSCILLTILCLVSGNLQMRIQQEKLARTLEVRIDDYPYPFSFPSGYYYSVLKPGMTIKEVHQLIKSYEKVLNCHNVSEIYYFYDSSEEKAERFEIRYDDQKQFIEFKGEEKDSRSIQTIGCVEGLLEP